MYNKERQRAVGGGKRHLGKGQIRAYKNARETGGVGAQ